MKTRTGFNRLGRRPAHRKALLKNLVTSFFRYERIVTTLAKAKEVRRLAEKLLTRAKVDSVHNRRIVARIITKEDVLRKLFQQIAPRFLQRPGGYTRVLKLGPREGDASEMAILELVERKESTPGGSKDSGKEKKGQGSGTERKREGKKATGR